MTAKWSYIKSGKQDAFYNMALDELLMKKVEKGEINPVLRLYEWEIPTLSIGYFQKIHREIDVEKVKEYGYQLVRRKTGGRGVLHDKELTYSLVLPENYEGMPHTVTESYKVLSMGLLEGFKNLGLDAYFSIPEKTKTEIRSSVCFDTPSWYELVVEGRKIAGSAQTRNDGVIMQHGSILLDVDIDHLFDMFKFTNERFKQKMKSDFKSKAVPINDLTDKNITVDELYIAFKDGFEKGLSMTTTEYMLTEDDLYQLDVLIEKYKSEEWNYKR
uniref:lipoate--protein ligase family protein n=1 Tax=Nosocomiicoccus ampullae TaxID=489910 RepID=UPI00082F73AF|nr:biotin/lipoate A/B protein ligase family protein [Nosocomiicoccus ampullae]